MIERRFPVWSRTESVSSISSAPTLLDKMEGDSALHIAVDHPRLSLPEDRLRCLIRHVIRRENHTLGDLSVVLSNRNSVLRMNREYLEHDYPTDVLAFDYRDHREAPIDGEIYIDLDTAEERCSEFGSSFEDEAARYVVHGLLHLMGHEDATEEAALKMKRLEAEYLEAYWTAP